MWEYAYAYSFASCFFVQFSVCTYFLYTLSLKQKKKGYRNTMSSPVPRGPVFPVKVPRQQEEMYGCPLLR